MRIATQQPKAPEPSRAERFIDGIIEAFSPGRALKRMEQRAILTHFRSKGAIANNVRPNAHPMSAAGNTMRGNRERLQLMWNAIELVENSGLCFSIVSKYQHYVCGSLRYQARTGDKGVNRLYEDYVKMRLGKSIDYSGRKTFRQMCMCGIAGQMYKGDFGLNVVRESPEEPLYLQGIEADRIGDPYEFRSTDTYIGGIHFTERGARPIAYDLFAREANTGMYKFDMQVQARTPTLGLPNFLHSMNPFSFDAARGKTIFATCIDNASYIESIRNYELEALAWASSQTGVYYTNTGALPQDLPFTNQTQNQDAYGNVLHQFSATPGTITALGLAEKVEMFKNERTSPNVLAMYRSTIRDICLGAGLSYAFVYDMSGLPGPAVRAASAQDKRSIEGVRMNQKEDVLIPSGTLILMEGISNGDIPFHPRWNKHDWLFPAHPTIDVGRESSANINENLAALNTGANIAAESGEDIEEIHEQIGIETESLMSVAMATAKRLKLEDWREVYQAMRAGKSIIMSPQFEAARAEGLRETAEQQERAKIEEGNASGDGAELD